MPMRIRSSIKFAPAALLVLCITGVVKPIEAHAAIPTAKYSYSPAVILPAHTSVAQRKVIFQNALRYDAGIIQFRGKSITDSQYLNVITVTTSKCRVNHGRFCLFVGGKDSYGYGKQSSIEDGQLVPIYKAYVNEPSGAYDEVTFDFQGDLMNGQARSSRIHKVKIAKKPIVVQTAIEQTHYQCDGTGYPAETSVLLAKSLIFQPSSVGAAQFAQYLADVLKPTPMLDCSTVTPPAPQPTPQPSPAPQPSQPAATCTFSAGMVSNNTVQGDVVVTQGGQIVTPDGIIVTTDDGTPHSSNGTSVSFGFNAGEHTFTGQAVINGQPLDCGSDEINVTGYYVGECDVSVNNTGGRSVQINIVDHPGSNGTFLGLQSNFGDGHDDGDGVTGTQENYTYDGPGTFQLNVGKLYRTSDGVFIRQHCGSSNPTVTVQ